MRKSMRGRPLASFRFCSSFIVIWIRTPLMCRYRITYIMESLATHSTLDVSRDYIVFHFVRSRALMEDARRGRARLTRRERRTERLRHARIIGCDDLESIGDALQVSCDGMQQVLVHSRAS